MKIPNKPIDLQAVQIPRRYRFGPVLIILAVITALYLDIGRRSPPHFFPYHFSSLWLLVEPDGSYRIADPRIESMDLILVAEQVFIVRTNFERRQWGIPLIYAKSETPVITLLPAVGTDPIELTPELRKLILAHLEYSFSEQGVLALQTGSQVPYTFRPFAFIVDVLVWAGLIFGVYWSARLVPHLLRFRRRFISCDRLKNRLCPVCEYSLTGLDQPVTQCPECGCSWFNQPT